jgi:hypothetical protein
MKGLTTRAATGCFEPWAAYLTYQDVEPSIELSLLTRKYNKVDWKGVGGYTHDTLKPAAQHPNKIARAQVGYFIRKLNRPIIRIKDKWMVMPSHGTPPRVLVMGRPIILAVTCEVTDYQYYTTLTEKYNHPNLCEPCRVTIPIYPKT